VAVVDLLEKACESMGLKAVQIQMLYRYLPPFLFLPLALNSGSGGSGSGGSGSGGSGSGGSGSGGSGSGSSSSSGSMGSAEKSSRSGAVDGLPKLN
jgi:hypothetical protein